MLRYTARRLAALPLFALVISVGVFSVLYLLPGDPARMMAGEGAPAQTVEVIREQMGFDRPAIQQYADTLVGMLQGDWGRSYQTNRPILSDLLTVFPRTLLLAAAAETISVVLGTALGVLAAAYRNTPLDRALMGFSALGLSLPLFWLAVVAQLLFAVHLGILPASGYESGLSLTLVLPAVTLAIPSAGILARMTRAAVLETRGANYVRTGYAKGLSRLRVMIRHELRNAAIPMTSIIATDFVRLLSGVLIIEVIFTWPGIGKYAYDALVDRDFPALHGAIVALAVGILLVNLVVDVLYGVVDARTRGSYDRVAR